MGKGERREGKIRERMVTLSSGLLITPSPAHTLQLLTVLAVGLLGSGAGGWREGRAGMVRALELGLEYSG